MDREALLARTLVELADTLVDDFDVVELLTTLTARCVQVLDVTAAGIMLLADGDLRLAASSSDAARTLELFELQADEGPCSECSRTGRPVINHDLHSTPPRWPRFGAAARAAGFRSVHALPMQLRGLTIGALNLFRAADGGLDDDDVHAAQALADVATIAILQDRAIVEARQLNLQLRHALDSRIAIEQAKGTVAQRSGLDMEQAFERLRAHGRAHDLSLDEVARAVVRGDLDLGPPDPRRDDGDGDGVVGVDEPQ